MGILFMIVETPWATTNGTHTPLKDVLAQLHNERGHFRNVTEASLQEELAADGGIELSDSSDDDEDPGLGKEKKQPTTRQELYTLKTDIWNHANDAHQQILLSLDMMSLLESKYAPAQAKTTMSPALSNVAPTGTLAADVWHRMQPDKAREAQDDALASKARMKYLQQSADDLLTASKRLEDNVRKETMFWDQILDVTNKGWSVSRIPTGQKGQQRLLGVHFGFAGCRPEFTRGIAALMTDSEGNIRLERGVGTKPKAVRAVLKKDGEAIGQSTLPKLPDAEETTLESRIRHARDSVFDEELYHEMLREARTLRSYDVKMSSGISIPVHDYTLEVELTPLDDLTSHESLPRSNASQAAVLELRLLLSEAHRGALEKRALVPSPIVEKSEEKPHLNLIRSMLDSNITL
ncbi:Mediator of RNA polymerase II transcription subunit 17 [Pseudocercospora fuligena]|uniref:Mediator of RNA polymerase II transcription subunit 17 n=1 Tax=Pseudocercospora fuligena TaxID=685502 RepID=A0A8H6RJ06_9PEZI|nr:Mediator of RNA polymerase II transcription subunit 17 [Pseudocercospora fuligena]